MINFIRFSGLAWTVMLLLCGALAYTGGHGNMIRALLICGLVAQVVVGTLVTPKT